MPQPEDQYDPAAKAKLLGPRPADEHQAEEDRLTTTLRYYLLADADIPDDDKLTIAQRLLTHSGLPQDGAETPHGRVTSRRAQLIGHRVWEVTVTIEGHRSLEPLDWNTDAYHIADGLYLASPADPYPSAAILNSAGDPYIPPPERTEYRLVAAFRRTYAAADTRTIAQIMDAHNSLNDRALPDGPTPRYRPRSLLCRVTRITPAPLQSLQIEIHISPTATVAPIATADDHWDHHLLDHGPYYKDDTGTKLPFLDETGRPTTGNLDGTGKALPPGNPPVFRSFPQHRETNWPVTLLLDPDIWRYL